MSTAVPKPTLGTTGYIIPSDADILTGVQTDINAALGGGVNPSLSTPQGQLATSETAIIADAFAQFLAIVSQTDPIYAQGRMQDAIGFLYDMTRFGTTPTTLHGTCHGTAGSTIPATTVAVDAAGNLYSCPGTVIATSGTVDVTFSNILNGPVDYVAPLSIYQSVAGWDSISAVTVATLGTNVESQQEFELRRQASVAINSVGILEAVKGAVLAVDSSLACLVAENPSGSPETVQGIVLPANSLFICAGKVNGSISDTVGQEIAQAIWSKKSPGAPYASEFTTGAKTFEAVDSVSGQEYPVWFMEAVATPINFVITLANATNPPSNSITLITEALQGAFAGLDGLNPVGYEIGKTLYSSRFYPAIAAALPTVAILGIKLGTGATPTQYSQALTLKQIPRLGSVVIDLA